MKKFSYLYLLPVLAVSVAPACTMPEAAGPAKEYIRTAADQARPAEISLTPNAIPGIPRAANHDTTGGYAPTNVQAELKINVSDDTGVVNVIRDTADPFVITKPYTITKADCYAVRSYLEAAVGARSVNTSPAQVTAVKYADGTGVVLVSAEAYRFEDSDAGRGIDSIVASLDVEGLTYLPESDVYVYFPRLSRAANLRDMLAKVGSYEQDEEFEVSPSTVMVDGELNALVIKAPKWAWEEMQVLLAEYDRPTPEVRVSYRVLEIYAENDDRIGVDFQSWKNNDGVDLFSAGTIARRNWGTFFVSGVQDTGSNRTSYWNFNPKWNTRYLDFMTSIGKAKCLAEGVLVAQNRKTSVIQVNSGFFYDRTYYIEGAQSIAEGTTEFAYTLPNPDTILRENTTKIMPLAELQQMYKDLGVASYFVPSGYTRRMMGTQTTTFTYADAYSQIPVGTVIGVAADGTLIKADGKTSALSKYLTGYVKPDGTVVEGAFYNYKWDTKDSAPGIIHGWLQYPMVTDGFQFQLQVTPVVTGKAAQVKFDLEGNSLLGWNSDGSARRSGSETSTTVQIGYEPQEFVIGGIRKSESVRGTTGLPFLKDLPVIGRLFSTESESIKQSQLVLIATVEYASPDDKIDEATAEELQGILKGVNKGMNSRVGNMFFQQYGLDSDRADRVERIEALDHMVNDDYKEIR